MFGKVTKTEWCLLGLTGIFLCGLLALSQHDRREMEDGLSLIHISSCMQRRDRYMVDHASLLIAAFDGSAGGTRYTVEYRCV